MPSSRWRSEELLFIPGATFTALAISTTLFARRYSCAENRTNALKPKTCRQQVLKRSSPRPERGLCMLSAAMPTTTVTTCCPPRHLRRCFVPLTVSPQHDTILIQSVIVESRIAGHRWHDSCCTFLVFGYVAFIVRRFVRARACVCVKGLPSTRRFALLYGSPDSFSYI